MSGQPSPYSDSDAMKLKDLVEQRGACSAEGSIDCVIEQLRRLRGIQWTGTLTVNFRSDGEVWLSNSIANDDEGQQ